MGTRRLLGNVSRDMCGSFPSEHDAGEPGVLSTMDPIGPDGGWRLPLCAFRSDRTALWPPHDAAAPTLVATEGQQLQRGGGGRTYQQTAVEAFGSPQGAHDAAPHLLGVPHGVQHAAAAAPAAGCVCGGGAEVVLAGEQTMGGGFTPPNAPPPSSSQTQTGRLWSSRRRSCRSSGDAAVPPPHASASDGGSAASVCLRSSNNTLQG